MKKLNRIVDLSFQVLGASALALMVGLVFVNAVMRYFFDATLPASEEIARFAFIWVTYMGAIMTDRAGAHISVNLVTDRISGLVALVFRILRELVVLGTLTFILVGSVNYTRLVTFPSPATGIPFWTIAISLSIASGYLLLARIIRIIVDIVGAIKKRSSAGTQMDDGKTREES